jgi:hypothetical protein
VILVAKLALRLNSRGLKHEEELTIPGFASSLNRYGSPSRNISNSRQQSARTSVRPSISHSSFSKVFFVSSTFWYYTLALM